MRLCIKCGSGLSRDSIVYEHAAICHEYACKTGDVKFSAFLRKRGPPVQIIFVMDDDTV